LFVEQYVMSLYTCYTDATRTDLSVQVLDSRAVLYGLEKVLYDDPCLEKTYNIRIDLYVLVVLG